MEKDQRQEIYKDLVRRTAGIWKRELAWLIRKLRAEWEQRLKSN